MEWNPRSSQSWASLLGLVDVPLYGEPVAGKPHASILLDGQRGTFVFFEAASDGHPIDNEMRSQAWSANALHTVAIGKDDRVHVERWDSTESRKFRLPTRGLDAEDIFATLEASPKARASSVVRHVLNGFRLIRDALPGDASLQSVQILNAFLLAANRARGNNELRNRFSKATVFGDILNLLNEDDRRFVGIETAEPAVRDQAIGALPDHFLDPAPRTGCELDPRLLFRHASTELYQEAHLEIERGPQSYFVGLGPVDRPKGVAPRDVRFTPANLARVLVEQAIDAYGRLPDELVVLDPACGSGVFLQQCLRELTAKAFMGSVSLHGYDRSDISTCIARFCLDGPVRDALSPGLEANVHIRNVDSLVTDPWAPAHLILMNPPFISRDYLAPDELDSVKAVLGPNLAKGRLDMTMAFIWKAVDSVRPGGVVATVLPTGLLQSKGGKVWRDAIAEICDVHLLGRFEGYKYFSTSIIETGFAVFRKREPANAISPPVSLLVAQEGSEDAAVRLLRLRQSGVQREVKGVDLYRASPELALGERWLPLRQVHYRLREWTLGCGLPTVSDVFTVNQGLRTRHKPAFILSSDEYSALPELEQRYFRPAAGQTTIVDGRLFDWEYVFYPYDQTGLTIQTEAELRERVPTYLDRHLHRFRSEIKAEQWWTLNRPRTWQLGKEPKVVSNTFARSGTFAFDEIGHHAVVQGYAWRRKKAQPVRALARSLDFAYLAVLNSGVFETLLSIFCRRVQGGLFEIADKYVSSIPLPDFVKDDASSEQLLADLAGLGRRVHDDGVSSAKDDIDKVVVSAYALPDDVADAFASVTERDFGHRT